MITADDVLSFDDINIDALVCSDVTIPETLEISTDPIAIDNYKRTCSKMANRFVHTFLEWDLFDKYVYHEGWDVMYYQKDKTPSPVTFTTRVNTLEEAKSVVTRKLRRMLDVSVRLKKLAETSTDDLTKIYTVVDKAGSYRGSVKIKRN